MTRDAYTDRLLDLAYGELAPREAREVEAHAAGCEACRAELAKIRGTRRVMAALPEEPASERGERILLAAAREAADRASERRRRPLVPRWLLGGAAVAASLVVVGIVSYRVSELAPRRDDRNALMGESRYAAAPPAAPAAAPETAGAAPAGAADAGPAQRLAAKSAPPAPEPPRVAFAPRPPPEAAAAAPAQQHRGYASAPPAARRAAAPAEADSGAAPSPPPAGGLDTALSPWQRQGERGPAVARAEPEPSAEVGAPAAPPPAAPSRARAPDTAERKLSAAPRAALSEAGPGAAPLAREVRRYPGCEGEAARTIERDARGRVVRAVREGRVDGRRLRVVEAFDADGRPAGVTVTDLDAPGAALDARALGLSLAAGAEDAADAPPRCGR